MSQKRVRSYSTRPFYFTLLILSIFAGWSLLTRTSLQSRSWKRDDAVLQNRGLEGLETPHLPARNEECNRVLYAKDQCAFVKANCPDEEAGLLSYLSLYYCRLHHVKPLAFMILALWLSVLFMTIGIAASDFFSPNLSTISTSLGMSESIAGVTFLAFGNGSPDVFSTFAAMHSHSGSLAVGELIGAASFITAVVVGSMALVQPFKVARKDFLRDVGFFVVAVSFSMVFMADGRLYLWECVVMVCSYILYVVCILVWHWWLGRRKHRRTEPGFARGEFLPLTDDTAEIEDHDHGGVNDLRYNERRHPSRGNSLQQVTILENGQTSPYLMAADEDIAEEARERWLADLNSNMRISRPSWGERRHTINPIRPSLVGALEFRAALSSLEKSPQDHPRRQDSRRGSYDPGVGGRNAPDLISFNSDPLSQSVTHDGAEQGDRRDSVPASTAVATDGTDNTGNRPRAVSENDAAGLHQRGRLSAQPNLLNVSTHLGDSTSKPGRFLGPPSGLSTPSISLSPPPSIHEATAASPTRSASPTSSPYFLVPPHEQYPSSSGKRRQSIETERNTAGPTTVRSDLPRIQIPDKDDELEDSNKRFSFPRFTESPLTASVQGGSRPPSINLSESALFLPPGDGDLNELVEDKPIWWWPYKILPKPSALLSTLFPTIYPWRRKAHWEKLLGLIAAPSVLLLTITLPVVEGTGEDAERDLNAGGQSKTTDYDLLPRSPLVLAVDDVGHSQNATSHGYQDSPTRRMSSDDQQGYGSIATGTSSNTVPDQIDVPPNPPERENPYPTNKPPTKEWNRWLVCIQIITAPLFIFCIIWANSESDPPNLDILWRGALVTFLASLIVLTLFISTTISSHPPRLHTLLCFVGFVVSVAWIATIAGEVVGVLKALGVILGISDAILGLTIFAVGNSLGDLVANITVARLGYQMMAFSACFGGPMLNILLGIGCGGLYMMIRDQTHWHEHHPHKHARYRPYTIEISNTLVISGATLLITLLGLLIWVPLNGWRMDRKIGWTLVGLWSLSTICNVIVEVSGGGQRLV